MESHFSYSLLRCRLQGITISPLTLGHAGVLEFFNLAQPVVKPTVQDYKVLAEDLFERMQNHPPSRDLLDSLGISSVLGCFADQEGTVLFSFEAGAHAHGSNPGQDRVIAADAARNTGSLVGFSSRDSRLPNAEQYAGAIRGFQHIISCRLVAISSLGAKDLKDVEDASEIFTLAYTLHLSSILGVREANRDMVVGSLSRYASGLLDLFDPFL